MIVQELITRLGFQVNSSQLNQYNSQLQGVASAAIGIGAGIATAVMGSFIKSAANGFGEFESILQQTKAVSGATAEQMDLMEKQALDLGSSTKFSAKEAAEAQSELSKAGLNVNQTLSATPGILSLASAGGLAVAKAAEIASGTLNAFGLEAARANDVSDMFAMGANVSAISVEDIGETVKYAASAFKGAGQSIEDFTALTAIMGNNMIKGSMAGTSLAGGISRLVTPPAEAAKALKKYNIVTHDSKGNMLNIIDLLINMKAKLKGATQQQKSAALTAIFGMEAAKGFNAVLNTSDEQIRSTVKSMHNYQGSAAKASEVMNSGLLPTIDAMNGSIETLYIKIGKSLSPALIFLANTVGDVANWFADLSPEVHKIIAAMALLTFGVGTTITAMMGYQAVKPLLNAVRLAFLNLNVQALLIPALIGLAIAAMVLFVQDLITFANGGDSIIGRFLGPFPRIRKMLLSIVDSAVEVYNFMMNAFSNLGLALQKTFGGSGQLIEYIIYALIGVGGVITAVVAAFVLGAASIILALGYIIAFIPVLISSIWSFISTVYEFFSWIGQQATIFLDALNMGIEQFKNRATQAFLNLINQIIQFFIWGITTQIPQTFQMLLTVIQSTLASIENFFSNMINNVVQFFSNAFLNIIPGFISSIGSSISNIASSIGNLITGAGNLNATIANTPSAGGAYTGNTQINNNTNVHVGGSNASPAQIGRAAGNGVQNGLKNALAGTANNYKGPVR